jgi:hypothetical protein
MVARLPFMLGASLALGLLAAIVVGMARPALPPLIPTPQVQPFVERWQEPYQPPLVPTVIRTIPITAPSPARNYRVPDELPPHRYVAPDPVPKKRIKKREQPAANDICRGKGKRIINNGRSWRCKR